MAKVKVVGRMVSVPAGQALQWRIFNHRRYRYQASAASKSMAGAMVKELRGRGRRVRTVRVGRRRDIYADTD